MWFDNLINVHSAVQGIVILSLICTLGLALGKIHVKGISLGIAFVFFVGIIAGHLGLSIDQNMLEFAESFGLTMFVYVLGLYVGPTSSVRCATKASRSISGVWQSSWWEPCSRSACAGFCQSVCLI